MRQEIKELLNKFELTPDEKQPLLFGKKVGEDVFAYIDFRKPEFKEKGRRFVKQGDNFDIDPDTIPELKMFKEERDKILQSSGVDKIEVISAGDAGKETNSKIPTNTISHQEVKIPPSPTPNLYRFFYELVGSGGIIEIFGDTGSLKTQACAQTCRDARLVKKEIFYLDTEGKVGLKNKKDLGTDYKYIPIWDEIVTQIKDMPKKDLLVIDSIGFPISAKSAGMKLNEQGQAWNDMMSLVGDILKAWAYKNNAIAIITNQPKSEFMKSEEEIRRLDAVGDKVHFAPNMILRTKKTILPGSYDKVNKKVIPPRSIGTFTSHRSPDFMDDVEIFIIKKNDDTIEIEIPKHVTKRLQELK